MDRIIYKNEQGGVSVIIPTEDALSKNSIMQIAVKDVPHGLAFKIVDSSEIPLDRADREAWTVDDSDLTDGYGGESNEFDKNRQK